MRSAFEQGSNNILVVWSVGIAPGIVIVHGLLRRVAQTCLGLARPRIVNAARLCVIEDEHQQFFQSNPNQGYCRIIIAPKVAKLRKSFASKLKAPTN